jgi:hypothetical protein
VLRLDAEEIAEVGEGEGLRPVVAREPEQLPTLPGGGYRAGPQPEEGADAVLENGQGEALRADAGSAARSGQAVQAKAA